MDRGWMVPDVADGTLLISMPEIAELAGVRRPVVTTWRRRYQDFPPAVVNRAGGEMFDARAVLEWLTATGRADRRQIEPDLRLYLLRCLGARLPARDLVAAATALICLRHLDDDEPLVGGVSGEVVVPSAMGGDPSTVGGCDPSGAGRILADLRRRAAEVDLDDRLLRSEVEALGPDVGWLAPVVDELVEAAWGTAGAYERLLAARHRLDVPDLYAGCIVPELARLIAAVSGVREQAETSGSVRVMDPSAGVGDLLAAVLAEVGEAGAVRLAGVEPDRFRARIARRRFVVAGLGRGEVDIRAAGSSRSRPGGTDVLVTSLPYRPGEDRGAVEVLASVRRACDALAPGQTAVLLGPADVLVDALPAHQSAVRRRNELLATGLVEAIVHLPGGMVPFRPGYRTALWVLRREDPSPWRGRVLLADVADRPLTAAVVDSLVLDVVTWRREGYRPDYHRRALASQAAISDLVTEPGRAPVALTAPRPSGDVAMAATAGRMAAEAVAHVGDMQFRLDELTHEAARARREPLRAGVAARDIPGRLPTSSVAQLAKGPGRDLAVLRILRGNRLAEDDIGPAGHHRVLGVPELTGGARPGGVRPGGRGIDRVVLARSYTRVSLTEPGDLVVTTVPRFGVYVDEEGFSVIEFPAKGLRITPAGRAAFTPRVLAALLAAAAPEVRAPGAVRASRRIEDYQVARLPPEDVERFDALLEAADTRRRLAGHEIDMLDELCRTTAAGLADGTLTLTMPTTTMPTLTKTVTATPIVTPAG